jgi:hypothetical protein
MSKRVFYVLIVTLMLCTTVAARASPYWIEYEPGNGHFPEEEGWSRFTAFGGDQRSLEDGWLVMDGTADPRIYDSYEMAMNGHLDPDPGELFIAQWRIRVDQVSAYYDPAVGIFSDEKWAVGFDLNRTTIHSAFEDGVSATFEPDVAHDFEFRSSDMRTYVLSIDGVPAIYGNLWLSLTPSKVDWGDEWYGIASLARWDDFSFGVVPECNSFILTACIATFLVVLRTRTRR